MVSEDGFAPILSVSLHKLLTSLMLGFLTCTMGTEIPRCRPVEGHASR